MVPSASSPVARRACGAMAATNTGMFSPPGCEVVNCGATVRVWP
ncbi:Uncharacterised protein [Mycobacteroides abscessus subsp. abscessus]|nr:Uncharacterised protein [Mycobacteroides abscessus subsp. abscessus]